MNKNLTIAIDGFSGCGKSTLAKDLAKEMAYIFIDTGAMYRGVTLFALNNGFISEDGSILKDDLISELNHIQIEFRKDNNSEKSHLYLNGIDVEEEIRTPRVASFVSKIATIKEVRTKLVNEQREMGKNGGVVMDGRDIGSVVFPDAELKLFVTANIEIRGERRLKELTSKGIQISIEEVINNLEERDLIDKTRSEGPLIQTHDAILVDTSNYTREGQLDFVKGIIQKKFCLQTQTI